MTKRRLISAEEGFTLLEAMAAVAVSGVIVLTLSIIAGQWIPNWRRGFDDLQRADLLSVGLERIVADLSAALYILPNGTAAAPLFEGEQLGVTFVRSSIDPNAPPHLEIVRLQETVDERGFAMVRARAPFAPTPVGARAPQYAFADPVALVRAPLRVSFAYAGPDRVWSDDWRDNPQLPDAVRITIRDGLNDRVLAASTAVRLKVTAPATPAQSPQSDAPADAQTGAAATPPDAARSSTPQESL